jgi:hypothetical protein
MLHRTQILLEPWQYDALRSTSEREGRSISDIVRGILTEALRSPDRPSGSWVREVAGIEYDANTSGQDHDTYLYGTPTETS